jgi:hypothetical protein
MLEVGGDLDFLEETLGAERRRELGLEDFDRDFAIMFDIVREIDGGHTARAELSLEGVAIGECSIQLLDRRRDLERAHCATPLPPAPSCRSRTSRSGNVSPSM